MEALDVGDPADEETDVGPLIAPDERDRVLEWIEQARDGGATILTGGELDGELLRADRGREAGRRRASRLRRGVRAGLHAAAVRHARRGDRARERDALRPPGRHLHVVACRRRCSAAAALEFGGVTVNEAPTFRADQMPYGGVKDSGNTREGPAWAVREMTEERLVVLQL